ncbi:MAG: histidine phosphatase family protein, partial [Planctomycetota bacterium]
MDLVLVRAGRTRWEDERRLQGTLDIPLSEEGVQEVHNAFFSAPNLGVKEIFASHTLCALQTARIIGSAIGKPVRKQEGFEEVDLGMWAGLRMGEIKHRHHRVHAVWMNSPLAVVPPSGEWLGDAYGRLVATLETLFIQ